MCASELISTGVKVSIPKSHAKVFIDDSSIDKDTNTYTIYAYDPYYDIRIIVALINSGTVEATDWFNHRLWFLGKPDINGLIPSDVDFPATSLTSLYNYIILKHSNKSRGMQLRIFQSALWYISCHCTFEIQQGVLKWISDYNNSATRQTLHSIPVQESSNYISLELINLA